MRGNFVGLFDINLYLCTGENPQNEAGGNENEEEPDERQNNAQSNQTSQRTNNNANTFRPMVASLPSGSAGRSTTATYSKGGRNAAQRTRASTINDDDDDDDD